MDVKAGPLAKPGTHLRMLVGGVVVDDQMHVQMRRDRGVDPLQEAEELLMPVMCSALGEHRVGGDVARAANRVVVPWRT